MSQLAPCPQCGAALNANESGPPSVCPACGVSLRHLPNLDLSGASNVVGANSAIKDGPLERKPRLGDMPMAERADPSAAPDDIPVHPEEAERWKKAAAGLRMLLTTALLYAGGSVALAMYSWTTSGRDVLDRDFDFYSPPTVFVAVGCSMLILAFMAFVGVLMCTKAPHDSARRVAQDAMGCLVGIVALMVVYAYFRSEHRYGGGPDFTNWLIPACFVLLAAAVTLLLMFQLGIAKHFEAFDLHAAGIWLLRTWCVCLAANLAIGAYFLSLSPWERRDAAVLQVVPFVANLLVMLWIPAYMYQTIRLIDANSRQADVDAG